jgi:phosphoglycolate phosphatase
MPGKTPLPRRLFLFDLDGTLVDSRDDIAYSLNAALVRLNLPPLPPPKIGDFVGEGVQKLIQRALREVTGAEPAGEQARVAAQYYLEEYNAHLLDSTHLYEGVRAALSRLPWALFAVVTNKPERFSRRILDGLGIGERFCAIVGGDSIPQRKPDPAPLRDAMSRCRVPAAESVMVGDSAVDVYAGKAAGIFTCGVTGGFRSRAELESAGCDLILSSLLELPDYFCPPRESRPKPNHVRR